MVPKEGKISNSGQNHEVVPLPKQGGTDTTQHNPIDTGTGASGTGTGASGTGTTIQNVYGTGTEQSGTGTTMSKMPRFL